MPNDATMEILSDLQNKTEEIYSMINEPYYNIDEMDGKDCMASLKFSGCYAFLCAKEVDFNVPGMMETAFDLVKLQEKGKIRNIGMCNMDTNALKQMVDAGIPVVSNQAQYSVFDRRPERTLLDYSAEHGIYTFAYGTLAGGFLAERYMGKAYEAPETRSQVKYMQIIEDSLGWDGMQKLLPVLKAIADHHGVSIANVATQYILNQKSVGAVMVGTRNSKHVKSNLQTLAFDLTEDEMKQIRDFVNQYPTPEGECYELERTSPRYKGIILTDRNHVE